MGKMKAMEEEGERWGEDNSRMEGEKKEEVNNGEGETIEDS